MDSYELLDGFHALLGNLFGWKTPVLRSEHLKSNRTVITDTFQRGNDLSKRNDAFSRKEPM